MAEALVSTILQQLASITDTHIRQQLGMIKGVGGELDNLTLHLQGIQAILEDAEERQVKEAHVRYWLENLNDVFYEIHNILDEWQTDILRKQIEQQFENEGNSNKKVRFLTSLSLCSCFGQIIGNVVMRSGIATRIKEINEKLTDLLNRKHNYQFQTRVMRGPVQHEQPERLKTSSLLDISSIIGIEFEKNVLISKLLCDQSSEGGMDPLIIPIVGMKGIGKTALAQLAYNDENVKAHFDKRIWVWVSGPFEEIKIAKAIIEHLNINDRRIYSNELKTLLNCIFESIEGKKFLFVLDDMWNPSRSQWEQLTEALQNGAIGSRIVVTTRNKHVPIMIGATSQSMHLGKLSDDICFSIFNKIVFIDKEEDKYSKMFEDIGRKIVKKCGGLPLAVNTLGSMMRHKKTIKEWEDVLESKIWDLKELAPVFQSLLLSYYDLNPAVKRCLLYCTTFPNDYMFRMDELIEFWMSQDYLNLNGNRKKERIVGESYVNNLAMRSFFQDFIKDDNGNIIEFKMNDIVHEFVQFLTKNECYMLDANNANEINIPSINKVRHMTLMFAPDGSFPNLVYKCKQLHTLVASDLNITSMSPDLIVQLKCLRTLALNGNRISALPVQIGALIHLRYLDISRNYSLKELPKTLGNLYNLQTLRLTNCLKLEKLPETIGKLIGLKNLYVACCDVLQLCKDIEKLTNLEILDELAVYDDNNLAVYDDNNKTFTLEGLKNFDQLRGSLRLLNLGKLKDVNKAKNAQLLNKKHLSTLKLYFSHIVSEEDEPRKIDEEIVNALQPHTNLEHLYISEYNGTTLYFNWMMSLCNLKSLVLQMCTFCASLPPLGKLPSLEYLEIEILPSVRKVGVEFLGIDGQETLLTTSCSFPKLKQLIFVSLEEWQEWEGVGESGGASDIMPFLSNLNIYECGNLKALPDFLWKTPLKNLSIRQCRSLEQELEIGRGMLWDKVSHIPNVHITNHCAQKDGVWMEVEPSGDQINLE